MNIMSKRHDNVDDNSSRKTGKGSSYKSCNNTPGNSTEKCTSMGFHICYASIYQHIMRYKIKRIRRVYGLYQIASQIFCRNILIGFNLITAGTVYNELFYSASPDFLPLTFLEGFGTLSSTISLFILNSAMSFCHSSVVVPFGTLLRWTLGL